ncbi:MAG: transketolase C-terminal domain-containing protein [Chloroflexota bacterium]
MKTIKFSAAVDSVLAQQMARDPRIVLFGEDVQALRRNLFVRFGARRVRNTPISESAFVGAAVTAAMAGLLPVVEVYMVDFLGVAMDALLNHAAKTYAFSGEQWSVPMVVRAPCGGGYGDGGQHEQSLWGWLAHIPGLSVVVPSNPADAGGLFLAALEHPHPVIFMEHKLLSDTWLDFLAGGSRSTISFDIPTSGAEGLVPNKWQPIPLGRAAVCKTGSDLTMISVGVGVHQALEAAKILEKEGISVEVIDLRTIQPLDLETIIYSVDKTGKALVIDEDYQQFGLSGELAAVLLEAGINCQYARVCTEDTIPFNRQQESQTLPNLERILSAAHRLVD